MSSLPTSENRLARPLVLKGEDRIEAINVRDDVRLEATLYSPTICRLLRRDFNMTSVKLFFYCRSARGQLAVQHCLHELADEATALENMARPYEMPAVSPLASYTMRIISDDARKLFDVLHTADRAVFKMQHSPLYEVQDENLIPFMRAYNTLRQKVFGFNSRSKEQREGSDSPEHEQD